MKKLMSVFVTDEAGAAAIEYVLLSALLGVAVVAGLTALTPSLSSLFTKIAAAFSM